MADGGDENQYWQPEDKDTLFPVNEDHPEPPKPNSEVEQEIADEINQAAAQDDAGNDNPTEPLPDHEVEISEPETEAVKTRKGNEEAIHWTASEAIDYKRGVSWYLIVALIVLAIIGVSVWLQLWTTGGLALVIFVAIVVITRRPARTLNYTLTAEGLYIEDSLHPFSEFRAFGVRKEGALWSIILIPVKRFGFSVSMYITEDQGEVIVDAFGAVLPMENVQPSTVDRIINRLKL